jgi:hypothetical protein
METSKPPKSPRVRLVAEIDSVIKLRLELDRVETRRPVNHIVEEILARHYAIEPPAVAPTCSSRKSSKVPK